MENIIDEFLKYHNYCQLLDVTEKGYCRKIELNKEGGYEWGYIAVLFQKQLEDYLKQASLFLNEQSWQKVLIVVANEKETQLHSIAIHIASISDEEYLNEFKSNGNKRHRFE